MISYDIFYALSVPNIIYGLLNFTIIIHIYLAYLFYLINTMNGT